LSKGLCIVTGAARGIGAATAIKAAEDGWDVAVNYSRSQVEAEAVADKIRALGRKAITVQGDMGVEADIISLFEQAEAELGPVKGLVTNAGTTGKITRVEAMTSAAMHDVMNLNVIGVMIACREAVKRMSTKNGGTGGAIVNLSSIAARIGAPGEFVHYAASKAAVDSWTWGLAQEVAAEGIRVNAVSPGMIDTEIHATAGDAKRIEKFGPTIRIGRAGQPEEMADAIIWLLSDKASYCVGTILMASGGR